MQQISGERLQDHWSSGSSSSYIRNFKLLACFCDCTGQFVSDLVGNPEDWFSRVAAQIMMMSTDYAAVDFFVAFH